MQVQLRCFTAAVLLIALALLPLPAHAEAIATPAAMTDDALVSSSETNSDATDTTTAMPEMPQTVSEAITDSEAPREETPAPNTEENENTDPSTAAEPSAEDSTPVALRTDHVRYLGGYEDRTVRPDQPVTRAEAAAIVYRLLEDPESGTGSCSYQDVYDGDWFAGNVRALCRLGLFDDGTAFEPNTPITRAELVDLLVRLTPEESGSAVFSDVPSDYWAAQQIGTAASMGWIGGYPDGTFRPENSLTRAEACSILSRMTGRLGDAAQAQKLLDLGLYTDMTASHWAAVPIAEASVAHDHADSTTGEVWQTVDLTSLTFTPGVHETGGNLYSVDRNGKLAVEQTVGAYWANANGALTQTASSYQRPNVPYISQIDEIYAWMGCEPISALMGLKALGYAQDVTPTAFLAALPITDSDPAKGFVGSPYHSDGRYSSIDPAPLAAFCNRYTNGSQVCTVFNGRSVTDVQRELLAGNMIVAWQTFSWAPVRYGNFLINGTYQARVANNHVRLICGYDPVRGYFVSDPYNLHNRGQVYQYWIDAERFESCWNARKMGMVMR